MTGTDLYAYLRARGLRPSLAEGRLRISGPAAAKTPEVRATVRQHGRALVALLRRGAIDPLPRARAAEAPEGALVEATRAEFIQRWGSDEGRLCWDFWTEWGLGLVLSGALTVEEALHLRDSIAEGPEGEHAKATISCLLALAPEDVRSRYERVAHGTPANGQPDAASGDDSYAREPRDSGDDPKREA